MRQLISGLVAAAAVMTVSAAPASACGLGLFSSCSPCGQAYVSPCAQSYAPAFTYATGCGGGCGGGYAASYNYSGSYGGGCGGGCGVSYERLPELSPQYYHVNQ